MTPVKTFATALVALGTTAFVSASTAGAAQKSISIILDASGSMTAPVAGGQSRFDAAKAAVGRLVGGLPDDSRLAFWIYGTEGGDEPKSCKDIREVVRMGPAGGARAPIAAALRDARPRGFTPLADAVARAAEGLAREESAEHVVILVSDGRETCAADPCVAARALARADAKLAIHTIGLAVDATARTQLACMADVARGRYYDAADAASLAASLGLAAEAPKGPDPKTSAQTAASGKGKLVIRNAGYHNVFDAETGAKAGFTDTRGEGAFAPGIYSIEFGRTRWTGVQIKAGETTVIDPGLIRVEPRFPDALPDVRDPETGKRLDVVGGTGQLPMPPGRYEITFGLGNVLKLPVEVKPGQTATVTLGAVKVVGKGESGLTWRTASGTRVDFLAATGRTYVYPPGAYTLETPGGRLDVVVAPGETKEIRLP